MNVLKSVNQISIDMQNLNKSVKTKVLRNGETAHNMSQSLITDSPHNTSKYQNGHPSVNSWLRA